MKNLVKALTGLGLIAGSAASPAAVIRDSDTYDSNCRAVNLTVSGTAQNRNLTGAPLTSLASLLTFAANAPVTTVSGPQTLAATYCKPLVKNANNNHIEMFFGSITADRNGWSAQGGVGTGFTAYKPEQYSWQLFANRLGYATLAVDRLGTGSSSHPDPVLVVQAPYEEVLYADLANQVRTGTTKVLDQKYSKLTYVGNSYGSQLGAGIAGAFPNAYDDFVLTGFTNNPQQDFLGVSLVTPAPAAVFNPARFGGLDPGYLTATSEVGRTNSFFGSKAQVDFEDTVAHLFFVRENTVSIGQFVSVYAYPFDGTGFKGRVLTLTGENDQAFCGRGSPVLGPAFCGPQLKNTGVLFPNADYNYQSVNRTGHAIQLHLSSLKVYSIAHAFIAGQEFKGNPPA